MASDGPTTAAAAESDAGLGAAGQRQPESVASNDRPSSDADRKARAAAELVRKSSTFTHVSGSGR